jgi:pyridoxamine 5'-phosphate oxidase family protein
MSSPRRIAVSWSWNLEGEPPGETWYEMRRTDH